MVEEQEQQQKKVHFRDMDGLLKCAIIGGVLNFLSLAIGILFILSALFG